MQAPSAPSVETAGTEPEIIIERPPEGLARGQYAWPDWGILLLGGAGVVVGLLYLLWRRRRSAPSS